MKSKNAEFIAKVIDDIQDFYSENKKFDCIEALAGSLTISETFLLILLLNVDETNIEDKIDLFLDNFKQGILDSYKRTKISQSEGQAP